MNPGQLRQRVKIQKQTNTINSTGDSVYTYTDVDTVWAKVVPIRARERTEQSGLSADMSHKVTIRHFRDPAGNSLTSNHRLVLIDKAGNRTLDINSTADICEKGIADEILCTEVVD